MSFLLYMLYVGEKEQLETCSFLDSGGFVLFVLCVCV